MGQGRRGHNLVGVNIEPSVATPEVICWRCFHFQRVSKVLQRAEKYLDVPSLRKPLLSVARQAAMEGRINRCTCGVNHQDPLAE